MNNTHTISVMGSVVAYSHGTHRFYAEILGPDRKDSHRPKDHRVTLVQRKVRPLGKDSSRGYYLFQGQWRTYYAAGGSRKNPHLYRSHAAASPGASRRVRQRLWHRARSDSGLL